MNAKRKIEVFDVGCAACAGVVSRLHRPDAVVPRPGLAQVCTPGTSCADLRTIQQRVTFWIVAVLLLSPLTVPQLAPLFY